jgi:hypothetical protein
MRNSKLLCGVLPYVICFLLCSISIGTGDELHKDVGTTAAQFLKIAPDARGVAMGEAAGAITNNENAIYWNPAGIRLASRPGVGFTHILWFADVNYEYLTGLLPLKSIGNLGLSVTYIGIPGIEKRTTDTPEYTSVSENDISVSLAYARDLILKDLFFGLNLKFINSRIVDADAKGFAADIGILYQIMNGRLTFGFTAQNIGTGLTYNSVSNPLPLNIKLSTAFKIIHTPKNSLLVDIDTNIPNDNYPRLNAGLEYVHTLGNLSLALRSGYKTGSNLGSIAGIGVGLGIAFQHKYGLDYAFVPYGELGNVHRLSIFLRF